MKTLPNDKAEPQARADARLDHDVCYQAVRRRDRRFDGRFYTAVSTTGIFCRPSCPARTPAAKNVSFYAHAAGAIDAGFRPCRRCRPELAPAHPEWNRRADLAYRALTLIERGVVDQEGVAGLASRLGVSERHLRRELISEIGTGPHQLAQVRRLWLARTLLDQTKLSITDIAFASGFSSIRQFNDAFTKAFAATPTELRRRPVPSSSAASIGEGLHEGAQTVSLRLASRGRLNWSELASFLAARAIPGLESFDDGAFRRNLSGGWIELSSDEEDDALHLTCALDEVGELSHLIPTVRVVADLDTDLDAVADHLRGDPVLAPFVGPPTGIGSPVPRLPGTFDRFELVVRAIVGQQVSVAAAGTTLGNLLNIVNPGRDCHERFPSADEILDAPLDRLGMPTQRRETIRRVAKAVSEQSVDLKPGADPAAVEAQLQAIRGIGPWTAGYIVMRAFSHPDGWPANDLVLAKRLGISGRQLQEQAYCWRPWRAYAAMTIWAGSSEPS